MSPEQTKTQRDHWQTLDAVVRGWWDGDTRTAQEADIRADDKETLLFLPYRYSTAGGSETVFPEMYGWDTYFINRGLLSHDRADLVRNHLLNHLFMLERYGKVLNGNRSYYLTRSQTPLLADSLYHYVQSLDAPEDDLPLLMRAYPLLAQEYKGYWNAEHHATPVGLATARDLGDPNLRIETCQRGRNRPRLLRPLRRRRAELHTPHHQLHTGALRSSAGLARRPAPPSRRG